jgi:hypothetical protein
MEHELKTWPEPYDAVESGAKLHEIRVYDRPYCVGDTLRLRRWDPATKRYTGRETTRVITYITHGGEWGLPPMLAVLSIALPTTGGPR